MSASTLSHVSAIRTFDASSFSMADALHAKGKRTISVCVPCKNEAATIGTLVARLRDHLVDTTGLVDELIVLDDNSSDETAAVAAANGATVVSVNVVNDMYGPG